jgi:hypothetical protein
MALPIAGGNGIKGLKGERPQVQIFSLLPGFYDVRYLPAPSYHDRLKPLKL